MCRDMPLRLARGRTNAARGRIALGRAITSPNFFLNFVNSLYKLKEIL